MIPVANDWKFVDNSVKVETELAQKAQAVLEEVGGVLEAQVKANTRVRTGQTKAGWQHTVGEESKGIYTVMIGNPLQNAIWEEYGTGQYALNGDGRKGGWAYQDPQTGETIWTHGKRPSRAFFKAYSKLKNKLTRYIQSQFGKGLK